VSEIPGTQVWHKVQPKYRVQPEKSTQEGKAGIIQKGNIISEILISTCIKLL